VKKFEEIKKKVKLGDYYISLHCEEELVFDNLTRRDIENAIIHGKINKKLTEDLRGTRYRIEGAAIDGRILHVICRITDDNELLFITTYVL
jgi:hypothetical protein